MRTTITLQPDVAAAVERLRRERGVGVSEAVNDLLRQALATRTTPEPFVQRTSRLGLRIDVSNVTEALDLLEGSQHR